MHQAKEEKYTTTAVAPFIKASPDRVFAASTALADADDGVGLVSAIGCSVKLAR